MILFLILGVALLGGGVMLLLRGLTVSSGGTDATLDQIEASYGFAATERLPEAGGSEPSRQLKSLAAGIGKLSQRVFGHGEGGIRQQLLIAGMYDTDPLTILGYRVLAAFAGGVIFIWVALTANMAAALVVLGAAVFAVIGWMLPLVVIKRRGRKRTDRIDYELPELIDLLVVTLEAGLSFLASLHTAAERLQGPLGTELRLTLQEQRMGLAVNEALEGMLRRGETPALRTFVRSIIQGESLGVSTGMIMRNLAVEMRKRRRATAEERAQKAPIKMLFPLIFLIFPAMFIVLLGPVYYSLSNIFGGQ
jgi:tight adherence protein C